MTVSEIAKYLRLAESTVYRLLKEKKVPGAIKIGGTWRINKRALDEFFQMQMEDHEEEEE